MARQRHITFGAGVGEAATNYYIYLLFFCRTLITSMNYFMKVSFVLFTLSALFFCNKKSSSGGANVTTLLFDTLPTVKLVTPASIREASGIAASKSIPNHLWVHEDSGTPTQLFLIGHDGKIVKTVFLKGIVNRDWEDMAIAGSDIYLADIGNNNNNYPDCTIYQFMEPSATTDTVKVFTSIRFKYEDGAHDAEALLVDPQSKDIFIITKKENPSAIYKIAYPYSTSAVNSATLSGRLAYSGAVGAALSPDGKEIIIKTYTGLNYYTRNAGESIDAALQRTSKTLGYVMEIQGEAVTFAANNSGFFTLSETGPLNFPVNLYFYSRK